MREKATKFLQGFKSTGFESHMCTFQDCLTLYERGTRAPNKNLLILTFLWKRFPSHVSILCRYTNRTLFLHCFCSDPKIITPKNAVVLSNGCSPICKSTHGKRRIPPVGTRWGQSRTRPHDRLCRRGSSGRQYRDVWPSKQQERAVYSLHQGSIQVSLDTT